MKIPICIVEDNELIRSAMEQVIAMDNKYKLVGSYSNAEQALEKIPTVQPNIILMDINLGAGLSGIECIRILKETQTDFLFMVCTIYEDEKKIFDALSAGANSYMLKKTPPNEMLAAIKELYEGGAPMSGSIARKIIKAFQTGLVGNSMEEQKPNPALRKLSPRETEILKLLSSGLLYKQIAGHLKISSETVRKHVYHIYEKLHVNNRVEAVNKLFNR